MRQLRNVILICATLSALLPSVARAAGADTLSIRVAFPKGVSSIEPDYMGNAQSIDSFLRIINCLNSDNRYSVREIRISTGASPEGNFKANEKLSIKRARSIMTCILSGTSLDPSQINVISYGENWSGLLDLIIKSEEPWAEEALTAIAFSGVLSSPDPRSSADCKNKLMAIQEGTVWRWMEEYAFERLRSAEGLVTIIADSGLRESVRDTLVIRHEEVFVHRDTVYSEMLSPVLTVKKNSGFKQDSLFRTPVMAFRSNLLVPLMNIGVEVPLSNRFSLGADWYYPWAMRRWTNRAFPSQMYCAQLLLGFLEARWWLGSVHSPSADRRYRLRGHSIGIVTTGGYYDLEYDGAGQQGEFLALGIDYLYALPLGKGGAHLEFNIGFGYGCNTYRDYTVPTEGGHLIGKGDRGMRHAPVPLRAGVSVAVPITSKREGR